MMCPHHCSLMESRTFHNRIMMLNVSYFNIGSQGKPPPPLKLRGSTNCILFRQGTCCAYSWGGGWGEGCSGMERENESLA